MIGEDKIIRRDAGVPEQAIARLQVIGMEIGECLEDRERDQQFADAAHVRAIILLMSRVTRMIGLREVEYRHLVTIRPLAEQRDEFAGEYGVGFRDREIRIIPHADIHFRHVQQGPARLTVALQFPGLDAARGLEPADAGGLIAVEGIRERQTG